MAITPAEILKKFWGYDSFRPLQEDIINSVLAGKDTLALLPTGGGKSICFQVPALCREGLCMVVTPLVALMTDQVENLKNRGIVAVEMHSGMHPREIEMAFEKCADGRAKFLYLSPERLETRKFREMLRGIHVTLIAVDEAHCISQWGYDFRLPYLRIAEVRTIFPEVAVLALTATAVPRVVEDIQLKLEFGQKNVFSKSFVRKNLAYVVSREDDKIKKLLRICNGVKGCGIIYVRNRRLTREIAEVLMHNGISASFYHAGLEPSLRLSRQHDWMQGRTRIIVATNAFGMGIDKPDVRLVVHLDLPDTLEAYYQEAGRVGRDGEKSYAVLLFNEHDIINSRHHLELAWPEPETIRQVYQALGNFLQLPVGAGKDVSFDFDLEKFSNVYKFKPITAFSSLKILERDGYISLNDAWDDPSRILFVCTKEDLYRYQLENAAADQILRIILRSYSGVFTDFTRINENEIARRSGIDAPKVVELLTRLQKLGILGYIAHKNTPQLIFNTERINPDDIALSKTFYTQRKKEAFSMLESTISYATSETECRSRMLVSYFGEKKSVDCEVCDICLKKRRAGINEKQSKEIEHHILVVLIPGQATITEIVGKTTGYKENDVLAILRWMVEEGHVQSEGENISLV
ncbi:MAG: RecQ family ATP-dependent DNA helicase [Bacteroidota bacterium]